MRRTMLKAFGGCLLCVLCVSVVNYFAWTTFRGNPQRTANTDGKAGPEAPQVLWVMPAIEHFITAPMPDGDRLYISGLGAFNVSTFYSLTTDPKAEKRAVWTKSTPLLKL